MDIDAQIRALEDQIGRETDELERARVARAQEASAGNAFQQPQQPVPQQQQQQQAPPQGGADSAVQAGEARQPPRFEKDADDRSIFISGLPTNAEDLTPELVAEGFSDCGPINKVTLLRNRQTNELKGTAYIEFATHEAVGRALDTKQNLTFRGNNLTVTKKRSMFNPRGRGRGGAPRGAGDRGGFGRGRGGMQQEMMNMMGMMMGAMAQQFSRGGFRGGRGRGRGRGGAEGQQQPPQDGGDGVLELPNRGRGGGPVKPF